MISSLFARTRCHRCRHANRQTSWDREKFFELDDERRAVITEVEELQATRNAESKKIGALMKEGKKDEAEAAKEAVRAVNEKIDGLAERRTALEQEQYDFMAHLPNIPCEATPYGKDEDENIERRRWAPRASSTSTLSRTGIWVPTSTSSTSSAATSSPAAVSPFSVAPRPSGARPHQLLPRYAHQSWL